MIKVLEILIVLVIPSILWVILFLQGKASGLNPEINIIGTHWSICIYEVIVCMAYAFKAIISKLN